MNSTLGSVVPLAMFSPWGIKPIEEYSVKSSERQNYTHLKVLKHQNSKTFPHKLLKNYGIIALFTRFYQTSWKCFKSIIASEIFLASGARFGYFSLQLKVGFEFEWANGEVSVASYKQKIDRNIFAQCSSKTVINNKPVRAPHFARCSSTYDLGWCSPSVYVTFFNCRHKYRKIECLSHLVDK